MNRWLIILICFALACSVVVFCMKYSASESMSAMPCIGVDCAFESMSSSPCIGSDCAINSGRGKESFIGYEPLQDGKMPCIGTDCAYTENDAINQAMQARNAEDRKYGI